jgi:Flp pilus assembly protein TadD
MSREKRIALGLAFIAALAFMGALRNGFTNWDDDDYVTQNVQIERLDPAGVREMFRTRSVFAANWAPLTIFSYAIDYALWGRRALGYHLTNVLLHVLCTLLLYALLARILGRGDPAEGTIPAAIAAALFAIHPVQVESVAWVAERKNVLGMALMLAAFHAWLRATEERFRAGAWCAFLLLLAASLLAKAQAVILPPLLLVYEWIERPRREGTDLSLKKRMLLLLPAFAMGIAVGWVTLDAQKVGEVRRLTGDLLGAIATAPTLILGYVRDLLLPMNRAAILTPRVWRAPWQPVPLGAWIVVAGWTAWALTRRRTRPHASFFSLWFLGALAPVLNLVPIPVLAADRYQYWAAPGLFALAGIGARAVWFALKEERRGSAAGLALCAAGFLAALSVARVAVWRDSLTLWTDAVRKAPQSDIALNNLGDAYNTLDRLDEAERWLRAAIAANPAWSKPQANLGLVLVKKGFIADGTRLLERSLAGEPGQMGLLAAAYAEEGRWKAAYPLLTRALASRPRDAALHIYLGNYYFAQGNEAQAMVEYGRAMALAPKDARVWNRLGAERFHRGETALALEAFGKALALDPQNPKARANLGAALLASGKPKEAEREIRKSLRADPRNAQTQSNLGAALLAQGRTEEAEAALQDALRIDPKQTDAIYNLACVAARRGDRDGAFRQLDRLAALGYRDAAHLRSDPDLAPVRGDPRFGELLARVSGATR